MIDHPFLILQHLIKNYSEACNQQDYVAAYQISVDITDQAQKLENFAQELANDLSQ
jgi:hypothetical protein